MSLKLGYDYAYRKTWQIDQVSQDKWLSKMLQGFSLNLCSGKSKLGSVKVDIEQHADIKADMRALPFRDQSFDTCLFDPPFNWLGRSKEASRTIKALGRVVKRRIIILGLKFVIPFIKGFDVRFYWKRYGIKARWFAVYERLDTYLEAV